MAHASAQLRALAGKAGGPEVVMIINPQWENTGGVSGARQLQHATAFLRLVGQLWLLGVSSPQPKWLCMHCGGSWWGSTAA